MWECIRNILSVALKMSELEDGVLGGYSLL